MSLTEKLREQSQKQELQDTTTGWDNSFEESLVSILIEKPELFMRAAEYLKPTLFRSFPCMFVMAQIASDYQDHGVVPARTLLRSRLAKQLTVDDPYQEIFKLVDRLPSVREIPYVVEDLNRFVGSRILGRLTSDDMLDLMAANDAVLTAAKVSEIYAQRK